MSAWMWEAREALITLSIGEQDDIYKSAAKIGDAVDGLDATDGMEVVLKLGQYLAEHPEGIRDDPN